MGTIHEPGEVRMNESKYDDVDVDAILSRSRPLTTRRIHLYEAPEFVKRLDSFVEAESGSTVIFECQLTGFPRSTVKWYKDEEEVTSETERYSLERDEILQKLIIEGAVKDDEGAYKCKAENMEGVASTTGYLSVKGEEKPPLPPKVKHHTERSVSYPPHLRTIMEQISLELNEEEACALLSPSPLHSEIEEILKRGYYTWPRMGRSHSAPGDTGRSDDELQPVGFEQESPPSETESTEPEVETPETEEDRMVFTLDEDNNITHIVDKQATQDDTQPMEDSITPVLVYIHESSPANNKRVEIAETTETTSRSIEPGMTKTQIEQNTLGSVAPEEGTPITTGGADMRFPWLYFVLLIAISTFLASALNISPHWFVLAVALSSILLFEQPH